MKNLPALTEKDGNRAVIKIKAAGYVRFRQDLGGGKLKNLGAGAEKCPRGGLWVASLPKGSQHC